MVVSINTNISSMKAQRRLNDATSSANNIFEQLSSGMRINKASDDAAGLAIAQDLNVTRKIYTQGIRNINDGQSLLSIADSTISNLSEIVIRIRELSEQAANGTLGVAQRSSLDAEAQALSKEFFRISRSASFNRLNLFDGTLSDGLRLQLGFGLDGSIKSSLGGALGTGTFSSLTTFATAGTSTVDSALGDVNGDGILDLISVGSGAANVTVKLGVGDGTFGVGTSYAEAGTPTSLALGDINGDGILDLVTGGTSGSGYTNVRLGVGNGTFGSGTSYTAEATETNAVALADLNQDGFLDLISAGKDGVPGVMNIRLGSASGSFGSATSFFSNTNNTLGISVGDLNGDGILDLVTTGSATIVGETVVRLGTGGGLFSSTINQIVEPTLQNSFSIAMQDLNNDGILDMVTGGVTARSGYLTVKLGNGDGYFTNGTSFVVGGSMARDIKIGDLNGDGLLDIITSVLGASNTTVLLGAGNGTFNSSTSYSSNLTNGYSVSIGDLDSDGVLDIVTLGDAGGVGTASVLKARTRDGISPLNEFSLKTKTDAKHAMSMLDNAISNLSKQRGVVGAFQGRLSVAAGSLRSSADNFAIAESRIKDTDIAEKAAELVRIQILQQAASAVLAQTNLEPQLALRLLQ